MSGGPQDWVYSGVKADWQMISEKQNEFYPIWALRIAGLIDLPFSSIADTICLPYTIPKDIKEKNRLEQNKD